MANPKGINQYTRQQGHKDLHAAINKGIKGINASLTRAAYRHVAAKAIVTNRKVLGGIGMGGPKLREMLYKTAALSVSTKKAEYKQFEKTLHPIHRGK